MSIKIKIIGIGGSGCNTISRITENKKDKIKIVESIALNTDVQNLQRTKADIKIQIGKKITQGLGSGMKPEIGKQAAEEQKEEIKEILKNTDMVFITCGMGGGTGSGASPIIAEIAKNLGILTIAIVTKPFSFEGIYRKKIAEEYIKQLREKVDSLIVIENNRLLETIEPKTSILNAFWLCDDILHQAVTSISDLITTTGIINVDFADVRAVLRNSGTALFGSVKTKGEKRTEKAIKSILNSGLFNNISCKEANGILFNITGGKDITLTEVEEAVKILTQEINPEAKVIFGVVQDEKFKKGEIKTTVIVTGFNHYEK